MDLMVTDCKWPNMQVSMHAALILSTGFSLATFMKFLNPSNIYKSYKHLFL